ncbi:uncharacterized protein MKK02DRAFT_28568 [Dioszegia hungarica]|uniref:RRM domain-containing protein n=1 Tax=Dioszegia hungarica TaxID=4972 RepID=A0AA38H4P8_9TREE|nr:uncharacterized protein MKK02DRAFT_28568 [Dioszegia hungarica]KAI9633802.1 hypothetical protein MKK02DRAFT_28568 [Dioszegia hungarica]
MDLDKPLDALIADKRQPAQTARPAARGGRVSRDRKDAVPYSRPPPRSTGDAWVHDAYNGPNRPQRGGGARMGGPPRVGYNPNSGEGFTGISPRIEVLGLHYEVMPGDLKSIFSQAGNLVQGPDIRYDVSGRSTGEATMEYSSVQEAKIAINKFDGAMTKGQTISIRFLPPVQIRPPPARASSYNAPPAGRQQTGASLLARIAPPPRGAPAGPPRGQGGPVRGRGGPARGRGGAASARPAKSGPPDAGNLDAELDSFMKGDAAGDVAMA